MNQAKKVVSINRVRQTASAYQGASGSVRATNWNANIDYSPNSGLVPELTLLRNRARNAYRNHPYIFKAINSLVSDEIGSGIIPRSTSSQATALNEYWERVSANIDPEGVLSFPMMMAQIASERRVAGEVFIRKRIRRNSSYGSPLQLQVLEADYCPENMNEVRPNGNKVRAGIEFNRTGQRVAYWFYVDHPADGIYSGSRESYLKRKVRIPARDVIHHFMPTRAGQLRGESDITQALVKTNTLEKYSDAEMQRKESKSNYTGAVYRDPKVFEADEEDTVVQQGSMNIMPNSMVELLPGETIELFDGDKTGSGYDLYINEQLRAIAAALEIPFEFMTGNFSNLNDRLLRGVVDAYRRRIKMFQQLAVDQICKPVWRWSLEAAVLTGELNLSGYGNDPKEHNKVEWSPEAWSYTNPVQDVQARVMEIDNGLKSRQQSIVDRGGDPELVDNQRKEDQDREDALELTPKEPLASSDVSDTGNPNQNEKPSTTGRK